MTFGDIYTVAGSGNSGYSGDGGAATSADLTFPGAIVFGPSDSFYIPDELNNVIREVDAGTSLYFRSRPPRAR